MGSQFDTSAEAYEDSLEMPLRMWMEEPSIRTVCGDVSGANVLDLGCGTGAYTRRLARWGARRVVGVDVSEGMLASARELEERAPLGVRYQTQDLTVPFRLGSELEDMRQHVDLALSVYVLCYATTENSLTQMCRAAKENLRPGGRFVAATMHPEYADEAEYPGWYADYLFRLTARSLPVSEGSTVRLEAFTTPPVAVDAIWWSHETYERALRMAGFTEISWHAYTVSADGINRYGESFWSNYLKRPHAVIIEAQ